MTKRKNTDNKMVKLKKRDNKTAKRKKKKQTIKWQNENKRQ
jgi:hypothetical protein